MAKPLISPHSEEFENLKRVDERAAELAEEGDKEGLRRLAENYRLRADDTGREGDDAMWAAWEIQKVLGS